MNAPPSHRLPVGFRVGTVFERTLHHLIPPDGRFGICGAPVAPETIVEHVADGERVCQRCIDRLAGRKPFVAQPPQRKPRPSPPPAASPAASAVAPPAATPSPAPTRVAIELPRRIAMLVAGFFDHAESPSKSHRGPVRYELLVAEAEVLADVLAEMGETRERARVVQAITDATSHPT